MIASLCPPWGEKTQVIGAFLLSGLTQKQWTSRHFSWQLDKNTTGENIGFFYLLFFCTLTACVLRFPCCKELNSAAVWCVMAESEQRGGVWGGVFVVFVMMFFWRDFHLASWRWVYQFLSFVVVHLIVLFFPHEMSMIFILVNRKKGLSHFVLHYTWAVWSLGEGQPPEELDKPIDTPPLSTLLIEKPQSATVAVGEFLHRTMPLKRSKVDEHASKGNRITFLQWF